MKYYQEKLIAELWTICLFIPVACYSQEEVDLFIWAGQSNAQGWTVDAAYYPKDGQNLDASILLNWTFSYVLRFK